MLCLGWFSPVRNPRGAASCAKLAHHDSRRMRCRFGERRRCDFGSRSTRPSDVASSMTIKRTKIRCLGNQRAKSRRWPAGLAGTANAAIAVRGFSGFDSFNGYRGTAWRLCSLRPRIAMPRALSIRRRLRCYVIGHTNISDLIFKSMTNYSSISIDFD